MRWALLSLAFLFSQPEEWMQTAPSDLCIPQEIVEQLSQPFTYLDEGSQLIAFASEDDTLVLKLFKARHKKKWTLSRLLRAPFKDRGVSRAKWLQKFSDTKRRYHLAMEHLQEETALVFLHFEGSSDALLVSLKGKHPRTIDLSCHPFILQKKVELAPKYIEQHPEKKEEALVALKAFFRSRLEKGFSDPRQTLSRNYGFLDGKAIQIDVGKIEFFEGDKDAELKKIYTHIDDWGSNSPL